MIKETKMELWNIILGFIIIIIIYCFYLNIINKYNKVEGFASTSNAIDSLINQENKIQKLIDTRESSLFTIKLWDNFNVLSARYGEFKLTVPTDKKECSALMKASVEEIKRRNQTIDQKPMGNFFKIDPYDYLTTTQCPISIWRSSPAEGFEPIGDVITNIFKHPSLEQIIDVTKPQTSNNPNLTNLKTKVVTGVNTLPPEDFIYVGGFGNDKVEDRLLLNERMNQDLKMVVSKLKTFGELMLVKKNLFIQNLNTVSSSVQNTFSKYVEQFSQLAKFCSANIKYNIALSDLISYNTINGISTNAKILELKNKQVETDPESYKIKNRFVAQKINFNVNHNFNIGALLSSLPYETTEKLKSIYDYSNEINLFSYDHYIFGFICATNLIQSYYNGVIGDVKNHYIEHPTSDISDSHSIIKSPSNVSVGVRADISKYEGNSNIGRKIESGFTWLGVGARNDVDRNVYSKDKVIGKVNEEDQMILAFHDDVGLDENTVDKITSMSFTIFSDYLDLLSSSITGDSELQTAYTALVTEITNFVTRNPTIKKKDFYRLSIWQPIPPPGYVALGFVFTNDPKDVKPSVQTIKCIPQTCVKSFKRRKWLPEDVIFIYSDLEKDQAQQRLAFYRNPYLGTCVVVDLNKYQNPSNTLLNVNSIKNPDPSSIKYRNDKDSLSWECFDIVPCVKECDYVKKLEDSEKNARQMCSAYRGLENQYFDKTEISKSVQDEENRYNTLLKDKKTYIENLMDKINKLMTEDELYKIISQNINRYNTKKDLEEQKDLHGKVADKLLQTRGLEISWDNPNEMTKFKDLVKRLVIAQFSKVKNNNTKRDCPVCKLPDNPDFVKFKDLELCYGCMEDVVRELLDKKKKANEPIPPELLALESTIKK